MYRLTIKKGAAAVKNLSRLLLCIRHTQALTKPLTSHSIRVFAISISASRANALEVSILFGLFQQMHKLVNEKCNKR